MSSSSDNNGLAALVYSGPAACKGCPEAVRDLLNKHPTLNISATIAGPDSSTNIDANSLNDTDIIAFPGGPDLNSAWRQLKDNNDDIREWVSEGGVYLGFCLGAFLAGANPGFGLLPSGINATREVLSQGAQVTNTSDSMLQVNWSWQTGPGAGTTENGRWVYFQDGTTFGEPGTGGKVIGRFSSNNNVAAIVSKFGNGSVGVIGFHPEAESSWYNSDGFTNPQGIKFDIGYDFISATVGGPAANSTSTGSASPTVSGAASPSSGAASSTAAMPQMALLLVLLSWIMAVFS